MRRLLYAVLFLLAVVLGGTLALYLYLQSAGVARQVASRLEAAYGARVEVGAVEVGLGSSVVQDLKLYQKPSPQPAPPWLDVKNLRADVSFWDMVRGVATPHHLQLSQPTIILDFDRDGRLVTNIPGLDGPGGAFDPRQLDTVPAVDIADGQIVFQKQGQAELRVTGVTGRLSREEGSVVVSGSGHNTVLGKLLLSGRLDRGSARLHCVLELEQPAEVNQAFLESLPFVPAVVWQELEIDRGETSAELTVDWDLTKRDLSYRLEMQPQQTALRLPSLEMSADQAQAKVIVADEVVELKDVQGRAFGGSIGVNGDLDFRGLVDVFTFPRIRVAGLDVAKLPPSWKFPSQITGALHGSAAVLVKIGPGPFKPEAVAAMLGSVATSPADLVWRTSTIVAAASPPTVIHRDGDGRGEIRNAHFNGFPTAEPIPIRWRPEGFIAEEPATKSSRAPLPGVPIDVVALLTTATQVQGADTPLLSDMLHVVERVTDGVHWLSQGVVDAVGILTRRVPQALAPAAPGEKTSYIDVSLKLNDIDLAEFVSRLNVKVPFRLAGKLTLQIKASLPVNRATEPKAYKAIGELRVADLEVEELRLAQARAVVVYNDGVLDLRTLTADFADSQGKLSGSARMQVVPLGELTAALDVQAVPLERLPLADALSDVRGPVSGAFKLRVPEGKLGSGSAWDASGRLSADELSVRGLSLRQASATLGLRFGILTLSKLQARLEGAPLAAEANLLLAAPYRFTGRWSIEQTDVAALNRVAALRLPFPVAGRLSTTADVNGTLQPLEVQASGAAAASDLGIGSVLLDELKTRWQLTQRQLALTKVEARLYDGSASGRATVPLHPDVGGEVALHLDGVDVRALSRALLLPVRLEGKVQGDVVATLPPAAAGKGRVSTASVKLTAPKLRVQNIPTEQLQAEVKLERGVVDYRLVGKTLGGSFELDGAVPLAPQPVQEKQREGKLRLDRIDLGRLAEALRLKPLAPLGGRVSISATFIPSGAELLPEGSGLVRLSSLSWRGSPIADNLQGRVTIQNGVLRLGDLSGSIAGGSIRTQLGFNLVYPERSWLSITLDNVDSARLLPGEAVEGVLSARIRGTLGSEWQGTADIELLRGSIYGLDVAQWRLPTNWRFAPSQGRGQLEVYETSANVARGRVTGRLSLAWDTSVHATGQLRFFSVDVQHLLQQTTGAASLGAGQLTGRFDFSGRDMTSLNDLSGILGASFGQTQALQVPLLRDIAPYLGVGPTTTFQKGSIAARLDRGVFRIQALALEGGSVSLFINGTVGLNERLNLEAVAKTGVVGIPALQLKLLGLDVPMIGPMPVTALRAASNLLSNRVVYLRITGSLRSPTIRPQPLPILTEEAVRFFIYRAAGVGISGF